MSDSDPKNDKPCLIDHHARLAVLERVLEDKIKALKDLMDLTFKLKDDALKLQFTEFMRRLDELNGHHAETEETLAATVTRDKYDTEVGDLKKFRDMSLGRQSIIALIASSGTGLAIKYLLP